MKNKNHLTLKHNTTQNSQWRCQTLRNTCPWTLSGCPCSPIPLLLLSKILSLSYEKIMIKTREQWNLKAVCMWLCSCCLNSRIGLNWLKTLLKTYEIKMCLQTCMVWSFKTTAYHYNLSQVPWNELCIKWS